MIFLNWVERKVALSGGPVIKGHATSKTRYMSYLLLPPLRSEVLPVIVNIYPWLDIEGGKFVFDCVDSARLASIIEACGYRLF